MVTSEAAWISNGGDWGIKIDYTWDAASRNFQINYLHGYRSNYLSRGNGTLVMKVFDNYGTELWSYSDYITMEFTKAEWSGTYYWQHDGRGTNVFIPQNVSSITVKLITNNDAFNDYIKNKTWVIPAITVGAVYWTLNYYPQGGTGGRTSDTVIYGGVVNLPSYTRANTTSTRTVTYDGNNGTPSTASQDSTATVTYSQKGFYTAASGGTKIADAGASYGPVYADADMYMQWNSSTGTFSTIKSPTATRSNGTSTRKVTFDATTNGGTCSTASANSTATVTYSCTGWWTAKSGGTKVVNTNTNYTPSKTQTVYAQWSSSTGTFSKVTLPSATKANGTSSRTVTINANGGSSTVTSRTSSATVTYSCSGWFTAASGGTKRGAVGGTYTPSASEKIYAQFTSSTGSYSAVTLPTTSQCTRTNYILLGFSTSSTATTATYAPGASYTPSADVILYAVWELAQTNLRVKVGGTWKTGPAWVKINGTWVKARTIYTKVNGAWVQCSKT